MRRRRRIEPPSGSSDIYGPGRAFAAPTITSTHTVDGGIDATGATDVTAALNAWVAAQPNGSKLIFPSGATYKLGTQGLQLGNRTDLELAGEGCTLNSTGGSAQLNGNILLGHVYGGFWGNPCARVQIHGFHLVSHNPTPGVYNATWEQCHAVEIDEASSCVEVWGITADGIGGDLLKVGNSTDIWMHDCHATDVGRQGLSVISGYWVTMSRCTVDAWGYYCVDVEPNNGTESCLDIYFRLNSFGNGGADQGVGHGFMAASAATFQEVGRVHITDNVVTYADSDSTLQSYINQNQPKRVHDIEFCRNTSVQAGGTAQFKSVDNLTAIGNTGAGRAITLDIINCTNVVTS